MIILTVVGARPQFIKAAVLSREFSNHPQINEIIVHTGQHFDRNMSDLFFEELEIPKPKYNLNLHSLPHGAMTGRMLEQIEKIILEEKPDYLLVYGDTNSSLAAALAAKKQKVKIIHVEAGLRNFSEYMPEDINRILVDRMSNLLFCPTDFAIECLKKEGFESFPCKIIKTGDIMQDSALYYSKKKVNRLNLIRKLRLKNKSFVLCTIHRAENTEEKNKLSTIVQDLNKINEESEILMPIHPKTKKKIEEFGLKPQFRTIEPVGYFDIIELLKHCSTVITDSGGLQKEAYMFEKKSVVLLDFIPWVELVENGFALQSHIEKDLIYSNYKHIMKSNPDFSIKLYGDGTTSKQIIQYIIEDYN